MLAHPDPPSFDHALADAAARAAREQGHDVVLHDLCAERFDPIVPRAELARDAPLEASLRRRCDELAAADGIVVVHPNWWGQPPAILVVTGTAEQRGRWLDDAGELVRASFPRIGPAASPPG